MRRSTADPLMSRTVGPSTGSPVNDIDLNDMAVTKAADGLTGAAADLKVAPLC